MLPYSSSPQPEGYYKPAPMLNVHEADAALRILNSSEKLLSDPKQTATALLAVKYGIFESSDKNLSYNLMALSKLLYDHPSAWNVVDQPLTDKVCLLLITCLFFFQISNFWLFLLDCSNHYWFRCPRKHFMPCSCDFNSYRHGNQKPVF